MSGIPATCELWVDGARFADTAGDTPAALDNLVIRWGRENRLDQPNPAQLTVSLLDTGAGPDRWDRVINLGSHVVVWADVQGARVSPFVGRVTDVTGRWNEDLGGTEVAVAAADSLADRANRYVGQEPWAAELYWQRAVRITGGSQADWGPIPWPPGGTTVSRMDVDRQSQTTLLTELAVSGGAIIYPVMTPAGAELMVLDNPTLRASLFVLGVDDAGYWRPMSGAGTGAFELPAADLFRDPVTWARTVVDQVTRVTVRYLDQTTSPGTTERSVGYVNAAAEAEWGARGVSLGTILTTAADAQTLAGAVLVRNQASDNYRARGLVWDLGRVHDPAAALGLARALLDSSARTGVALVLADLPDWTPATADGGGYVEGGDYAFTGGRWVLSLTTTSAVGAGRSATFAELDRAMVHNKVAADVSYLDLRGVGVPAALTQPKDDHDG